MFFAWGCFSIFFPAPPAQPLQRAAAGRGAGREARLQQVAAGRRLPVEHLAGGEHAGQAAQHEALVELVERDAARGRDRACDRRDAGEADRHGVDEARKFARRQRGELAGGDLLQQTDLGR